MDIKIQEKIKVFLGKEMKNKTKISVCNLHETNDVFKCDVIVSECGKVLGKEKQMIIPKSAIGVETWKQREERELKEREVK